MTVISPKLSLAKVLSLSIWPLVRSTFSPTSSHSHMKLKGSVSSAKIYSTNSKYFNSLQCCALEERRRGRWNPIISLTILSSIAHINRRSQVASVGGSTSETQNGIKDDLFCGKMRTIHPVDERTYQDLNLTPPSLFSSPLHEAWPLNLRAYGMPLGSTPSHDIPVALSSQDLMLGSIEKIFLYLSLYYVYFLLTYARV